MFKVGDKVMLNPDKDEYTYGKGTVLYTDVGEITAMLDDDNISVYFPNNPDWWGKEDDLILFIEMKSNIEISDDGVSLSCTITDDSVIKNILDGYLLDFEEYCNSENKDELIEREEKDMNKVLKLYYDRKREEIEEKYIDKVNNDFDNIEIIKQYKILIENFEKEQEALFKTVENFDNDYLDSSYDSNLYKYSISEMKVKENLMNNYEDDKANEIEKLKELVEEVDAQLSLSDDLNYQMEVLTRYDILDKKTNKVKA